MQKLIRFIVQYDVHIKYGLLMIVIFSMIVTIRNYLNYVAIQEAIRLEYEGTNRDLEHSYYIEKFLLKYGSSSYADYFLAHENNVLFNREILVRFKKIDPTVNLTEEFASGYNNTVTGGTDVDRSSSARDSWNTFFGEILKKNDL